MPIPRTSSSVQAARRRATPLRFAGPALRHTPYRRLPSPRLLSCTYTKMEAIVVVGNNSFVWKKCVWPDTKRTLVLLSQDDPDGKCPHPDYSLSTLRSLIHSIRFPFLPESPLHRSLDPALSVRGD